MLIKINASQALLATTLLTSGSKNASHFSHGSLAQLGEHLPYKQRVIGSIPITSTIYDLRSKSVDVQIALQLGD